jgi:hypothetical protein
VSPNIQLSELARDNLPSSVSAAGLAKLCGQVRRERTRGMRRGLRARIGRGSATEDRSWTWPWSRLVRGEAALIELAEPAQHCCRSD